MARETALQALSAVRITEPERRLAQYPHELSGGMRQRVMIAMALAGRPKVLIADEPTTALDVTVQAQILDLIRSLQREFGMAVILITHDMGVVAEMADRVVIMHEGQMVETGAVERIFAAPRGGLHEDAACRRAAARRQDPRRKSATHWASQRNVHAGQEAPVVEVRDLTVGYDIRGGLLRQKHGARPRRAGCLVPHSPGETLALVGESGCGKSTTGKALLGTRALGRGRSGLPARRRRDFAPAQ